MTQLIDIDNINSFKSIKDFTLDSINEDVIKTIKNLNEKTQLEPFIRSCIYDLNDTPHGPTEIVDILTTKITYKHKQSFAAIIIKGKSFKTVKAKDISHQIYRLRKIDGIQISILAYTGNILDQPMEEFISTCHDIGCDYSIWNDFDLARILTSEGFICPRDGEVIEGNICKCGYKPVKEELNIFQEEAIKELDINHKLKQKYGLVILPTGAGKTRIAVKDILKQKSSLVLYIAHTYEILYGAIREFKYEFLQDEIKLIKSKSDFKNLSRINLVTIQLLRENQDLVNNVLFDYIIIDEFHHAAAKSYLKVQQELDYNFLLGLTATPYRADRKDIAELCNNNIIVNYELRDGIDSGILSPYHYYGFFDDINYSDINYNGINYDVRDLERALIIPERDKAIINKWQQKAMNKSTIGFCCSQKHAERSCDAFNAFGIPSKTFLSYTSDEERKEIIEDFKKGEIKVVFTVDVLNEGVDFPFVECLLFLRPTETKRIFMQQLGRGLRRFQGKSKAIVLDFIGNFINAYRIVEYFGLSPYEFEEETFVLNRDLKEKNFKSIFNLPIGCDITFDEKVINVFSNQIYNKSNINRHNIYRILIQQYLMLCEKIGRRAKWKDIDHNCRIGSSIYKILFTNIMHLNKVVENELKELGIE